MPLSTSFDDVSNQAILPEAVRARFNGAWHLQGEGVFTWSVFRVYRMALHVLGEGDFDPNRAFALDLNYLRNVSAPQIAETSVQEMRRISVCDESDLARWGTALGEILPDVKLGDRLIGVFAPECGVAFYSQDAHLGDIAEPAFAQAFAGIWLDALTRAPKLRAALLGQVDSAAAHVVQAAAR